MKSFISCLFAAAVCTLGSSSLFAQDALPAVSLGDPIPIYDSNVVQTTGSCNACAARISVQPCCEQAKPCSTCSTCPSCAIAARPAPCKAWELPKVFHRAPASTPCSTCSTPAPAPCKTCSAPAPVACNTCATKPVCHVAKPAPCSTCSTPTPAPCKVAAAPCATCAKAAPAPCSTCGCNTCAHKTEHSRPILDALKRLFASPGHHAAPASSTCSTCSTCQSSAPVSSVPIQTVPTQPAPATIPQQISYQNSSPMPVNAAIAPYAPQATYSIPVGESIVPIR